MSDEKDTWSRMAQRYDTLVASGHPMYERYAEVLDEIATVARVGTDTAVLDIGAGTGNLTAICLRRGATVTAVDPSQDMLNEAQRKLASEHSGRLRLMRVDDPFIATQPGIGRFDAVISSYAFHHVHRYHHPLAVAQMSTLLNPGGICVIGDIAFPDTDAMSSALQRYCWLEAEEFPLVSQLRQSLSVTEYEFAVRQMTSTTWLLWWHLPEGHVHA